ncbi:MAG: cytochrome P450 [Halobacteriales archaeon]
MDLEPPGPKGLPVIGNNRQYARNPLRFLTACREAYGNVVKLQLGREDEPTYMLNDPAAIERVLVGEEERFRKATFGDPALEQLLGSGLLFSEGMFWKQQRQLAQPAFQPDRIQSLGGMMTDYTQSMLEEWDPDSVVDIQRAMATVTVRIIVDAMFDTTLKSALTERLQEALLPIGSRFEPSFRRVLLPEWVPTEENRTYQTAVETLDEILEELIRRRRGTESEGDDLLSILLRAQDDPAYDLSNHQLRDELMTMLLAGHDTTALALTYTWYLLDENPEVRKRFHEELDAAIDDTTPTVEDVMGLETTDRILTESMRLYPPVYIMFREPIEDITIDEYPIQAGTPLLLSQWAVHRDDRFYENPEQFDPDRWRRDRARERPNFAYFPFGGGPRHCIGKHLAMLEAKLILATIGSQYRLDRIDDGPLDISCSLTLHPSDPVEMRVIER